MAEVTLVVAHFLPLDKANNFCLSTIVVSLQPVAKTSSEPWKSRGLTRSRKSGRTEKIWFVDTERLHTDCRKLKITSNDVYRSRLFLDRVRPTRMNSGTWKSKLCVAMITTHQNKRLDELNNFCEDTLSWNWALRCEKARSTHAKPSREKWAESWEDERERELCARK